MSADTEVSQECAFVDLSSRAKVRMSGADAVLHLHKFCTNDIVNLPVGRGCEAFVLDAKGQVQFYALVHRRDDGLLLELPTAEFETDAAARLIKFLGKYVIVENVVFSDETDELGQIWIGGADAPILLADAMQNSPPDNVLEAIECPAVGAGAWLVRGAQGEQPNFTLFGSPEQLDTAQVRLSASGITEREFAWYDAARIAAGVPLLGRDIVEKTLPQEINRNEQSLNFRKGCYLGQETVSLPPRSTSNNPGIADVRISPIERPGRAFWTDARKILACSGLTGVSLAAYVKEAATSSPVAVSREASIFFMNHLKVWLIASV